MHVKFQSLFPSLRWALIELRVRNLKEFMCHLMLSLSLSLSLSLPRDFVRGVVYVRPSTNICDSRMFVIHIHEQLSVRETCSELNQVLVDFEYFVMSSVQPTQ